MTKKDKILRMFNSLPWLDHSDPKYPFMKMVHRSDLKEICLHNTIELGEKYTDIHYVQSVLRKQGYVVRLGSWVIYILKEK